MILDDDRPIKPKPHAVGMDLAALSIDELEERVDLLKAEIARLEAEIAAKGSTRAAAESFFSKS
jgi:uncharacterized small protein (DUF1192 family)